VVGGGVLEQVGLSVVLETLIQEGFSLVQLKVGSLTSVQAKEFLALSPSSFPSSSSSSPSSAAAAAAVAARAVVPARLSLVELLGGPVLVVAVEKDCAVSHLHKLLRKSNALSSSSLPSPSLGAGRGFSFLSAAAAEDLAEVFQYAPKGEFPGDKPALKAGCVSAESSTGAARHLEFFFNELFGANQILMK